MNKLKLSIVSGLIGLCATQVYAATDIKLGQEKKSAAGVEKIIALSERQQGNYWVASFVRDGACPESSGRCSHDLVLVRGPGGVVTTPLSDASFVSASFSDGKRPLAAVILQEDKAGYAFAAVELFTFSLDNKPQSLFKTPELLLNNLDGAACQGKKLCAESKLNVLFQGGTHPDYPDLIIRQSGTALRADANGVERIDLRYVFVYDAATKKYSAKR